jgi:DNA-binding CsgD family transcriptional regulator
MQEQQKFDSNGETFISLTRREAEVLGLVLEGRSSREMATTLFCSKRTIDFHLARIYEKLRVSNRVQAVRRATLLGLVSMEPVALPK